MKDWLDPRFRLGSILCRKAAGTIGMAGLLVSQMKYSLQNTLRGRSGVALVFLEVETLHAPILRHPANRVARGCEGGQSIPLQSTTKEP